MSRRHENTQVLFPHLDNQLVAVEGKDGSEEDITRWELISEELQGLRRKLIEMIASRSGGSSGGSEEFSTWLGIADCICAYYPEIKCNFEILEGVFVGGDFVVDESGARLDLDKTVIFIIDAALALPVLFDKPFQCLSGELEGVEVLDLSRDQICSILANAFFCTFSDRAESLPRINFTTLFDDSSNQGGGWRSRSRQAKIEKLKCFLNYFSRMKERFGKDLHQLPVTYERRKLRQENIPNWENCTESFCPLTVVERGRSEDSVGGLQVDFANKFVGGGTLGNGTAMEEIRFACCPELVASQLFTPKLGPLDVLLVHKFSQFSSHQGYGSSFEFAGNFYDAHTFDNHLVAMDAYHFSKDDPQLQFQRRWIDRELNKCLSAFQSSTLEPSEDCDRVASGKWGCGVFNGHPLLKCLIQWMAASYSKKSLELYTFGDSHLTSELNGLKKLILNRPDVTVGKLYSIIVKYGEPYSKVRHRKESLFQFIQNCLASRLTRVLKFLSFVLALIVTFYWTLPVGIITCVWVTNDLPQCLTDGLNHLEEVLGLKGYLESLIGLL